MVYIAWFVLVFTIVQLLIALANLYFNQKLTEVPADGNSLVSLLIPARNEEKNVGNLLSDILNQDYQNIEVFVFNDMSGDNTARIVNGYATSDSRIKVVDSTFLPDRWRGKNWACHSMSKLASGKFILFLDADVRIGKDIIGKAISYAEHYRISLLSIFPAQIMDTTGEKMTVPIMNFILLSLLPLVMVRKSPFKSFAAANGQFMLFRSDIYRLFQPHERLKNSMVEDIRIARYFKEKREKVACLAVDSGVQCRMYQGFKDAVNGFSKNVFEFFGNSAILALLFWIVTSFGFLLIIRELTVIYVVIWLIAYVVTRIIISILSGQNITDNLIYLIPQQLTFGLFIYQAFINKYFKTFRWKGREIYQ